VPPHGHHEDTFRLAGIARAAARPQQQDEEPVSRRSCRTAEGSPLALHRLPRRGSGARHQLRRWPPARFLARNGFGSGRSVLHVLHLGDLLLPVAGQPQVEDAAPNPRGLIRGSSGATSSASSSTASAYSPSRAKVLGDTPRSSARRSRVRPSFKVSLWHLDFRSPPCRCFARL
jgi:hypothetical protein